MITIKELEFKPHPNIDLPGHTQATHTFKNGYTASIVTGEMFYTSPGRPYEIAICFNGNIIYDTPLTSDVIGHLDEKDANEILKEIAELPPRKE